MNDALHVLQHTFGYPAFRGPQADIIASLLAGDDALVLMPTGGGKSLCYQIPALLRSGCGIVVSPLIALMQDQVDTLRQLGVRAACLNSTLDPRDAWAVEQQLLEGQLDLLYVAPERLLTDRFLNLLQQAPLALFAIDEAHCVSQWGHDFRPEYMGLSILHERWPQVPRIALTATADHATRQEMIDRLGLQQARQFITSFDRPNIRYRIAEKNRPREQALALIRTYPDAAGIIYCLSRKRVEDTAAWLRQQGIPALHYHAGLDSQTRQQHQQQFLRQEGRVMVATIAFGMGIDKPDVRYVIHLDLPKSIESYYQETGRAGRDGEPAEALLLYGMQDVVMQHEMIAQGEAPPAQKRLERQKLDALLGLCESSRCRRQHLLAYFGEDAAPCGNCDNCLQPPETWDATDAARRALSCVFRCEQRFGAGHVIDVLLGKRTPKVEQFGHHALSTFGIGSELGESSWRVLFRQLLASGYLESDPERFGALQLTELSRPLLRGETTLTVRREPVGNKAQRGVRSGEWRFRDSAEELLWQQLRQLRRKLADEQGVPPYMIFGDTTLRQLLDRRPQSLDTLRDTFGIGDSKLSRYGDALLAVLQAHHEQHGPPSVSEVPYHDSARTSVAAVRQGRHALAVASERQLSADTIYQHLSAGILAGDIDVSTATGLDADSLNRIELALQQADVALRLKPAFDALDGEFSYGLLRCVRSGLQRQER